MNARAIVLCLLPLLCLTIPEILTRCHSSITLFPVTDDISMGVYDDSDDGGNSTVEYMYTNNFFKIIYTLGDAVEYPYAGIYMHITQNGRPRDLSRYSHLSYQIESKTLRTIKIFVSTTFESYKAPYEYELLLQPGKRTYTIPFSALQLPEWWLLEKQLTVHDIGSSDFSRVTDIDISNGSVYTLNEKVSFTISRISLMQEYSFLYVPIITVLAIFYIALLIYLIIQRRIARNIKNTVVPYNPLVFENITDTQTKNLLSFLAHNYAKPDLSVSQVSDGACIPKNKIPEILKKEFQLSFPQYLNLIRLTEAKRLLEETDLQIIEIALNVGFNNVTHFNRTFKKVENISPKLYRVQNTKKL